MSSTTVVMQSGNATPHILRAFKMTGPGQMFREVPVNASQAGATKLYADTLWQAVEDLGVHYRTFEDDGCGMLPEEMPTFLNAFGGSGKTIGISDDNFGIGFKTSTLPDNPYGVVILSYRDGTTSMMWLWTDEDGNIGARRLISQETLGDDSYDEFGEELIELSGSDTVLVLDDFDNFHIDGINWAAAMPQWIIDAGHGTCFALLGKEPFDPAKSNPEKFDTINDFGGITSKYGFLDEISARFWTLPLAITLRSYNDITKRDSWPTSEVDAELNSAWRHAEGMEDYLNSPAVEAKGTVLVSAEGFSDAVASWYIFPARDDKQGSQRGDRVSHPFIGALYESHPGVVEVMDLKRPPYSMPRLKNFIGPHEVARHISIVIEPVNDEVYQDGTRTQLRHTNPRTKSSTELPWGEWAESFVAQMPDEIQKRIDLFFQSQIQMSKEGFTEEDKKRLGDKFNKWVASAVKIMKLRKSGKIKVKQVADGKVVIVTTEDGDMPRGASGHKGVKIKTRNPNPVRTAPGEDNGTAVLRDHHQGKEIPSGTVTAMPTTEDRELPQALFVTPWEPQNKHCALEYDPAQKKVLVNPEHFYLDSFCEAIRDHYKSLPGTQIQLAVNTGKNTAWLSSASLAVAHQLMLAKEFPAHRDAFLNPEALTAAMAGIRNHFEVAQGHIGAALGKASKKQTA